MRRCVQPVQSRDLVNNLLTVTGSCERVGLYSDHSITPKVSYDSCRYALDEYRKHMLY